MYGGGARDLNLDIEFYMLAATYWGETERVVVEVAKGGEEVNVARMRRNVFSTSLLNT